MSCSHLMRQNTKTNQLICMTSYLKKSYYTRDNDSKEALFLTYPRWDIRCSRGGVAF